MENTKRLTTFELLQERTSNTKAKSKMIYDCLVVKIKDGKATTGWVTIPTTLPDGEHRYRDLPAAVKADLSAAEAARSAAAEAAAEAKRKEEAEMELSLQKNTAYTVIAGHRSYVQRAASESGCNELHYIPLTKGGGNIMIIVRGYPKKRTSDKRVEYIFCPTWEQVAAEFGDVRGNTILTRNPAQTIGRGGETIKFLSSIAGKRLKVVAI